MEKEEMDDEYLTIIDDEGNESTFKILFTYDNEERGVSYVLFFAEDEPENIMVCRYDEETKELFEIEDEEEFNEIEEVLHLYEENDGDFIEEEDAEDLENLDA